MNDKTLNEIIANLDLSGGEKSWFDLWHTHLDWHGESSTDWEKRNRHFENLDQLYQLLKAKLQSYPKQYQLWILVDPSKTSEDAVYIHTPNPNAQNFPLRLRALQNVDPEKKRIIEFFEDRGFKQITEDTGGPYYFMQPNIGLPLAAN